MIKGSIQEEDIIIVNIYAPNTEAPQNIRQTLTDIKGEIDSNATHSHQQTDHQNRKSIRKHVFNDTLDEMDLIDIFRTFHPNAEEYTFFRIDHILGHKSNFSKFKEIEIVSGIFSGHKAMRLDINYKKKKKL